MLDWKKQAGIKIAGRNINNLRYADDTTLMAESEELKSHVPKGQQFLILIMRGSKELEAKISPTTIADPGFAIRVVWLCAQLSAILISVLGKLLEVP